MPASDEPAQDLNGALGAHEDSGRTHLVGVPLARQLDVADLLRDGNNSLRNRAETPRSHGVGCGDVLSDFAIKGGIVT